VIYTDAAPAPQHDSPAKADRGIPSLPAFTTARSAGVGEATPGVIQ